MNVIIIFVAGMVLTACNHYTKDENMQTAKADAVDLTQYVDSVENLPPIYTVANWTMIDNGYRERAMRSEKSLATLEAADKKKSAETKVKYAALKATYEAKLKANETAVAVESTKPDYRRYCATGYLVKVK